MGWFLHEPFRRKRVSDARPITNITDFVCGSCWNSFSRTDPGVVRGTQLICPHCGHVLPLEAASADLAAAVRNAKANVSDAHSAGYPSVAPAVPDPGFPSLEGGLPYNWMTGDAEPPAEGFMVGEPDDFDFNEATLRPDQNRADLMELVRNAPARPHSDDSDFVPLPPLEGAKPVLAASPSGRVSAANPAARPGSPSAGLELSGDDLFGAELGVDADELTPADGEDRARQFVASRGLDPAAVGAPGAVVITGATDDDAFAAMRDTLNENAIDPDLTAALEAADEPNLDEQDWKLKAMGLTYNFHGLDALIGWASNKAGQPLAISPDGQEWKDFGSFFEAYTDGVPTARAFAEAAAPGSAPPAGTVRAARVGSSAKVAIAPPDLSKPGTVPSEEPAAVDSPAMPGALGAPTASSSRPVTPVTTPASGAGVAGTNASSRRVPQMTGTGKALGGKNASGAGKSLSSGKASGKLPAAQAPVTAQAVTPAKIAVAVLVLLLLVAVLLHFQGFVRIPGLP